MSALVPALIQFVMGRMRGGGGGGGGGGRSRGGSSGYRGGRSGSGRSGYGSRSQKSEENSMDKAYQSALGGKDDDDDDKALKELEAAGDPGISFTYDDFATHARKNLFN
jgi:hypothetical protein